MHRLRTAVIAALTVLVLSATPAAAEDVVAPEEETIVIGVVETVGGGATIEITPSGDVGVLATPTSTPVRARTSARSLARTGEHTTALLLVALASLALGTVMVRASSAARYRSRPDVVGCGAEHASLA